MYTSKSIRVKASSRTLKLCKCHSSSPNPLRHRPMQQTRPAPHRNDVSVHARCKIHISTELIFSVFFEIAESSQPRVTTATHPTTSTQTRSTARPQIHVTGLPAGQVRNLRPVPIPTMQLPSFDRYLPCNSHHVREPEQRDQPSNAPRRSRVHIQTAPGPSRTTIPHQLASLLTNNRRGSNPTASVPLLSTTNRSRSAGPSDAPPAATPAHALNDAELDTVIPIFGSNQIQLQVRDLANVSPTPSTLNRIRSDLRNYIATTLCFDNGATEENIQTVR